MIAILDNQSFTDKLLSTTIEQTFNARRLTAMSDDLVDLTALTPYHILLGQENASASFLPLNEQYHGLQKRSKRLKHMQT